MDLSAAPRDPAAWKCDQRLPGDSWSLYTIAESVRFSFVMSASCGMEICCGIRRAGRRKAEANCGPHMCRNLVWPPDGVCFCQAISEGDL